MRRHLGGAAAMLLVAAAALAAPRPTPLERANALLAQMTLDEKISLAADGSAGVPRLGIRPLRMSDGPNGVRNGPLPKTAFPAAETVAASWDTDLATRFGVALGAEATAQGFNLLFAPTVNILRTPLWGRAAETLGEDPFLAGRIAAAEIRGMQSQHVIAQVKHFAANNQEIQRTGNPFGVPPLSPAVSVVVSERTLEEIYFPAFRAAVTEGGAGSVMCSYPRINGVYACQNPATLGALKDAWGFAGFVGPDAILAVRDTLAAIAAGVDNFQLGGVGIPPVQALHRVSMQRLDDMVRRILRAMLATGLFEPPPAGGPADHRALATEIAAAGSVLLKNDGDVLPLGPGVGSIAVIGHDAGPGTQTTEGGSAAVVGGPVVTPLDAIGARAGQGVQVRFAPGTLGDVPLPAVPADVLTPSSGTGPGLLGTYWASMDASGSPLGAFVSPTIDFTNVLPPTGRSARFTGTLTPTATGTHRFSLAHAGVARLFIDGRLVASGDNEGLGPSIGIVGAPPQTFQGLADLTAGHPVPVTLEYSIGSAVVGTPLHLGWQPPDPTLVATAVAAARASDVAVVFASDVTGEGMDRTALALPGDQDALIAAVAAANPRTVVVLHTAGPVLMPWLPRVAAVVEAWYPGERSGDAIAALLFGDVNPSGRLAMTFPADETQGVGRTLAEYPGVGGEVHYDEGIDVGYRFYDRAGQAPLFPFGHGLSYTSFALERLRLTRRRGGTIHVSVRVTNTGHRAGAEVVQLYVGYPAETGEPPNQLRGFAKVALGPGQRKRVRMTLGPASFALWDTDAGERVVRPGTYALRVGRSSRALPLAASVQLRGVGLGP